MNFIKTSLKDPSQANINKYKQYRNKLTSIIKTSKEMYFSHKFEHSRGSMSATWKNINDVIGRTKQINLNHKYYKDDRIFENPDDIVNGFNDYFVNVGQEQASKIPNSTKHFTDFLGERCHSSLFFNPIPIKKKCSKLLILSKTKSRMEVMKLVTIYSNLLYHTL